MNLAHYYRRQLAWRDWPTALDALPSLQGQTVLDLGCGVGDVAALLVVRGARVIGFDINEELLDDARSRNLPHAEFRSADLRYLPELPVRADGVWCSFGAAYFPDLPAVLAAWSRNLKPAGWIALTEIDDLFGHEPLGARAKALLAAYGESALAAGRYDFQMGRKVADYMERGRFKVSKTMTLEDREFSFRGPALPQVLDAWRTRLEHMQLLRDFCGPEIERVQAEFLDCLARADHRSVAQVRCCIGSSATIA